MTDAQFAVRHIRGELESSGLSDLFKTIEEFVDEFYERGEPFPYPDGSYVVNEGGVLVAYE